MEREPLVSIIVAVYKAEAFLETCVEQLRNQTYQNLEILLVEDGSPDRSGELAEELAKRDTRIKVFHKQNGGVGSALNVGIEQATGEYIANVDGDDLVHPDMIRRQMEIITSAQVEIVITAHQEINERQLPTDVYVEDAIELLDRKEVIRRLIEDQDIQSYFWGKLYKAEIIKKLRFPEDYTYEDTAMLAEILMSTDCIAYSKSVYYFYYMNPNSILHSRDLRLNLQQLRAYEKQMQDIVTVYPEFQAMLELRHFRLELSTYCYYLKQYVGDAQYTVALQKVWREMSARKKSMAKAQIKLLPAEHLRFLRCRMQRILRHVS